MYSFEEKTEQSDLLVPEDPEVTINSNFIPAYANISVLRVGIESITHVEHKSNYYCRGLFPAKPLIGARTKKNNNW